MTPLSIVLYHHQYSSNCLNPFNLLPRRENCRGSLLRGAGFCLLVVVCKRAFVLVVDVVVWVVGWVVVAGRAWVGIHHQWLVLLLGGAWVSIHHQGLVVLMGELVVVDGAWVGIHQGFEGGVGELVVVGGVVVAYPPAVVVHQVGKMAVVPYTARLCLGAGVRGDLVVWVPFVEVKVIVLLGKSSTTNSNPYVPVYSVKL